MSNKDKVIEILDKLIDVVLDSNDDELEYGYLDRFATEICKLGEEYAQQSSAVSGDIEEAKQIIRHLKAYGLIHIVTGVKYVAGTHADFIDRAEKWLQSLKGTSTPPAQESAEQVLLDYTASTEWDQIAALNWTTVEVIEMMEKYKQQKP